MRVYIASPYGDHNELRVRESYVAMADYAARQLALAGHIAITPLRITHRWNEDTKLCPTHWWAIDQSLLRNWAECLVRLPGHSPGADIEEAIAIELGMPVYYGVEKVPNP